MKILLVEDNPDDLLLGRLELARLGHTIITADNGAEALNVFERERPDVVVTDIYLPGMDGFALTNALQQRAAPRWQPVIFLSGHRDDEFQIRALQTGADAYIVKPVTASMLDAKLNVIQRLLTMQRQAEARAYELERYYAIEEEEKRIARHLIERLVNLEKLADPMIRHWQLPATALCGDLVAAARAPGGVLHLLLANGTGRGLVASINALPLTPPFYRMTEKGFGIDAIARELNNKIRQFLPPDCHVAATLASVDFRENIVQIWNGGNPEPFLLDPEARSPRVFGQSRQLLGACDDMDFVAEAETHAFVPGAQLILYSDGLLQAENAEGLTFGYERLATTVVNASPESRFQQIVSGLRSHLAGRAPADDISLVLVDCFARSGAPALASPATASATMPASGNWRFALRLSARELRTVDLVPLLLGLAGQLDGAGVNGGQLFVVLSELANNALDHGLLRLDSRLKLDARGMEAWIEERALRLCRLEDGEIEFELEQLQENGRPWLRILCRDSGPGFSHQELRFTEENDLPFGRGIALVRSLCARVQYNEAGNAVSVLMVLGGAD